MAKSKFPLFKHASGQWAKKVRGKFFYFGKDKEAALNKYLDERDYLLGGRPVPTQGSPVAELLDEFLGEKNRLLADGEISAITYAEYQTTCDLIAAEFKGRALNSLDVSDFDKLRASLSLRKNGQRYSLVTLKRRLTIARMVFAMGKDLPYKKALKAPSKRAIRKVQRGRALKMYSAADLRKLVAAADPQLKAIILLGLNCAFGPKDCVTLPASAIKGEWCEWHRAKTEIDRRCL